MEGVLKPYLQAILTISLTTSSIIGLRTTAEANCDKYWTYVELAHDASKHADAYDDENNNGLEAAANSEALHWKDMANNEIETCNARDALANYYGDAADKAFFSGNSVEMLQLMVEAYSYGLALSEPNRWASIRQELKSKFELDDLPFLAPERHGTAYFAKALAAIKTTLAEREAIARQHQEIDRRNFAKRPKPPKHCIYDSAAEIVGTAAELNYPDAAREAGAVGTAIVAVSLSSDSKVLHAEIQKSAGNSALDDAAIESALGTKYKTEIVECHAKAGTFLYQADFTGQ